MCEELTAWGQCDLRVARILSCVPHCASDKLYIEQIDCGEGRERTILSGLQKFIALPEMTQGLCIVFANLKPKKLAGDFSEGMVMCADNSELDQIQLMRPPEGAKVGERIQLEGNPIGGAPLSNDWQKVLNPKRKIEVKLL